MQLISLLSIIIVETIHERLGAFSDDIGSIVFGSYIAQEGLKTDGPAAAVL
jgi:hypothetical protein